MESYSKHMPNERAVFIWGALYGEMAYMVLTQIYHKDVEAIIDNKLSKVRWADIKVIRTKDLADYSGIDILVCGANAFNNIVKEAEKYKDRDIRLYDIKEIMLEYKSMHEHLITSEENSYIYGDLDLDEMILKYNYYSGEDNGYDKNIYLSYCVLCITSRCSLRCKNCAAFITKYQKPVDYSLEYVKDVFGKFLDVIDDIQELELMGGEPFLCNDFNAILQWCLLQKKIRAVKIITNGTILPSNDMWELLKNNKVKLVIDDYGVLSSRYGNLIELAKKYHVRYELQKLQTWYQLEPIFKKGYSDKEKSAIFQDCVFRTCIGVTNGRLYHCNVSGHMNTVGLLADEESDFIELKNKSWDAGELRKEVRKMLSIPYLKACDYCNYSSHHEVLVAEQERNGNLNQ